MTRSQPSEQGKKEDPRRGNTMHKSYRGTSRDLRLSVALGMKGPSDREGHRDQTPKGIPGVLSPVVCCWGYKVSSRRKGAVKGGLKKA